MPSKSTTPTPEPIDPLAAFDALADTPAPLTDGAIRCCITGCNGIVRKDFVFSFGADAEHKLGLCYNKDRHQALVKQGKATKAELSRGMKILDKAVLQNS